MLKTEYSESPGLQQMLKSEGITLEFARSVLHYQNDVHQEVLNTNLNSRSRNAVNKAQPSLIADEKLQLPRQTRVTLA